MYKLIRPLLFLTDEERVHALSLRLGKLCSNSFCKKIISLIYNFEDARLNITVAGIKFKNPVGLAPGFDKNGLLINFFPALGFGFVEFGTVTPLPQPGNEKPRLFRLPEDHAIINRMRFNGLGAEVMKKNLTKADGKIVVGVNLGKNKSTPNELAWKDYENGFEMLANSADYVVINISSPNTPGLRELFNKQPLLELLKRVQNLNETRGFHKPVFLKVVIDLTNEQLDSVIEAAKETNISAIITTNTTIQRLNLKSPLASQSGGLSGRPLTKASTEMIGYLYKKLRGQIPIIGAGGIFSAEDAYEKICAGASLIQIYTGLIYEGPALVKTINQGLVQLLQRDGFKNISEAVGSKVK